MVGIRRWLVVACALAVLTLGGAAAATHAGGGVVASASGSSKLTILDMFGFDVIEVRDSSFEAQLEADGSVLGRYNYITVDDGQPFFARGRLTCLVVDGNRAWLGGLIDSSSDPTAEGLEMWFQVADNGEPGADETPDLTTLIGAGGPGTAQDYCDRAPEPTFPFFLEHGNIQVR